MKLRLLPVAFSLGAALAACSTPGAGTGAAERAKASASRALYAAIDDAYAAQAAQDDTDLSSQSLAEPGTLSALSVEPFVVVRRTHMHRTRELLSITIDLESQPWTATAELQLGVKGRAELWQVYPASGTPRQKLGQKPIDMLGVVTLGAEKHDGRWRLTSVEAGALTQGDLAAGVSDWSVSPDPLIAGSSENEARATLSEPDTSDAFLVLARGPRLRSRGVLNDNGMPPDATPDDDTYAGLIRVEDDAEAGEHLAFIHAFNYTRTIDLSQAEGAYLYPYTDTLLPVTVTVASPE